MVGLTGRCQLNEVPEEGREAVTVDGSFLGEGDQGEGQAWRVLAKQGAGGGWPGRGGQRPGAPALRGQDLTDALGLREVRAGRDGPYATGHLTDPWGGGPGGFAAFPPLGVSQAGTKGGPAGLLHQEGNLLPRSSMWLADPDSLGLWGWGHVPPPPQPQLSAGGPSPALAPCPCISEPGKA